MYAYDVFLSYSNKDRGFVERLAKDLKRAGAKVWLDQYNLQAGEVIARMIERSLAESRLLIPVMSPDYFESPWCSQELNYALNLEFNEKNLKVIPVLYRECKVPEFIALKQYVDFRNPKEYWRSLDILLPSIVGTVSSVEDVTSPTANPGPGEYGQEFDPAALAELKQALTAAVDAFKARPVEPAANESQGQTSVDPRLIFVIMPFTVEELNIVFEDFIRPTLEGPCDLRAERGDDVFGSNFIMEDVLNSIKRAGLILADLTGKNPNVFYEVGIAHALNKKVLLLAQSIDDVPFDLRYRRVLIYDYSPHGCKKLEKDLYDNIRYVLAD